MRCSRSMLAAALVVGGCVSAGSAVTARPEVASASRLAPAATTPLWSARRLPGTIVDAASAAHDAAIGAQLQPLLDAEARRFGATCYVVTHGSTVLAQHDADVALVPASTQKLLTAAAALVKLGPDFRYETSAVTSPSANRATLERLWLVGSGDPVIRTDEYATPGVTTPLEALADRIVAAGVRSVGTIVGDDGRYDAERYRPTWSPEYRAQFDIGPLGALTVTQGIALVVGSPGTELEFAL